MKVKVLSHDIEEVTRPRHKDIQRLQKNTDPLLHPFQKQREYVRALNAVKLEKLFAKPFICALDGHREGVYAMTKNPFDLKHVASGSADGEIIVWDLGVKKRVFKVNGHDGFVRGLSYQSDLLLSCSDDQTIKLWKPLSSSEPRQIYKGKSFFSQVDFHRQRQLFATSGSQVDLWDIEKSEPIQSFSWGADTIHTIRFNHTEQSLFASSGTDRNIILYDVRHQQPLSKVIMRMKTNAISWHPMEAYHFAAASEDYQSYLFDMRNLKQALNIYKDHVSAVLDVDFSPTGHELVTSSYDKTLRIYETQSGHSRDIYHTKRMQHAFCVQYSMDANYILSGSDDGNVRLWKSVANEKLGPRSQREVTADRYKEALIKRFQHLPEIKKIKRQHHVPKAIYSTQKKHREMVESEKRKEERRRKHEGEHVVPYKAERKKPVLAVEQ